MLARFGATGYAEEQRDVHWTGPGWYITVEIEFIGPPETVLWSGPYASEDQCVAAKTSDPSVGNDPSAACTYYATKPNIDQ